MKKSKCIVLMLFILSVLLLASCSNEEEYEAGSGTASRNESIVSDGLVDGGTVNDASDWGPVIGIN